MDDSTLDKLFSEGLGEEQEFDFREEDWEDLSDRLKEKKKRRWLWAWWAVAACLLVSVGINMWQAANIYEVKEDMAELQETILDDKNTSEKIVLTKPIEHIIIQRDTIIQTVYRTIIQEKEIPIYIESKENTPAQSSPKGSDLAVEETTKKLPLNSDKLYAEEAQQFIEVQPAHQNRLDLLPALPLSEIAYSTEMSLPLGELDEQDKKIIRKASRPQRWQMGPNVAYSKIPDKNCVQQRNTGIGWEVDYRLSKKWILQGDISYNAIHSTCISTLPSADQNGDALVYADTDSVYLSNIFLSEKDLDEISPLSLVEATKSDNIQNIRSHQAYIQFSLGAKYMLPKQFYVGANILGYRHLRYDREYNVSLDRNYRGNYEYLNSNGAYSFSNLDSQKQKFTINRLQITAGKEFKLRRNIRIPVELYFQKNFTKSEQIVPPLLGIRVGFLFKL